MDDYFFNRQEMDTSKIFFLDECPRRCPMWRNYSDCIHMYDDNTALKRKPKNPKIPRKMLLSDNIMRPAKDEFIIRGCYDLRKVPTEYHGFVSIVEVCIGKKTKKRFIPHFSELSVQESIKRHHRIKRRIVKLASNLNIIGHYDDLICSIDKYRHCNRVLEDSMHKYDFWTGKPISDRSKYAMIFEMRLWFAEHVAIPMMHKFRKQFPDLDSPIFILGAQVNWKEITDAMHAYLLTRLQLPKPVQEILSCDYPYLSELTQDFRNNPNSFLHNELKPYSWLFDLQQIWDLALQEGREYSAQQTSKIKGFLGRKNYQEKKIKNKRCVLQCTFGIFRRHVLRIHPSIMCPVFVLHFDKTKAMLLEGLQNRGRHGANSLSFAYPHSYNNYYG